MSSKEVYESESYSYMNATAPVEGEYYEDDSLPPRDSTSSPRSGALAFTIDFEDEKKKLSLRDGIRRFAPSKKGREKSSGVTPVTQHPTPPTSMSLTPVSNTNIVVMPKSETMKSSRIVVDCENNIDTLCDAECDDKMERRNGDAVSDAGTYTIDQDEEADIEDCEEETKKTQSPSVNEMFSVRNDVWSKQEWVDQWASTSLPATGIVNTEDDFEDDDLAFMSLRDNGEGGRSRRRLPPTPMSDVNAGTTAEDCMQDTIALMASMEARLSSSEATAEVKKPNKPRLANQQPQTPVKKPANTPAVKSAASNSSASKANKAAERLAAWQRRKNYDPLKSATNGKKQQAASRPHQSPAHSLTEESFSESCSDHDLHSDVTPHRPDVFTTSQSSQRFASTHSTSPVFTVQSASRTVTSKSSPANQVKATPARPNRAFALRQTNSIGLNVERTPSKPELGRPTPSKSELGRLGQLKTSLAPSLSMSSAKKSQGLIPSKSGRSTSSLSSKEAEYQAWKRRKNYNPLQSAAAGSKKEPVRRAVVSSNASHSMSTSTVTTSTVQSRRMAVLDEIPSEENVHRSASFHYPDGFSRVHHNVYTSEDEDLEPVMIGSGLYEVNEDELVLAIGHTSPLDNGSFGGIRKQSHRNSPSRGSPSRLEALDNLVISTIFSVSTKLCMTSGKLIRKLQDNTHDKEQLAFLDTLLYVLEDVEPPISPSKKTSRELSGTLRNLKKVEQALQTLERCSMDQDV